MKLTLTVLLAAIITLGYGQANVFEAQPVELKDQILDKAFLSYSIYRLDILPINEYLERSASSDLHLKLGQQYNWHLKLVTHDMRGPNFREVAITKQGNVVLPPRKNITYRGTLDAPGGGEVRASVTEDFFMASVVWKSKDYFIEPLNGLIKGAAEDLFILYEASEVIPRTDVQCGATQVQEYAPDPEEMEQIASPTRDHECLEVEFAIASDSLMFNRYGSVAAVNNRIITVTNLMEPLYAPFNLDYIVVDMFVATTTDPWTDSDEAFDILDDFKAWAPVNMNPHDVGQIWTARDIQGCGGSGNFGLVGCAEGFAVICTGDAYNVCEDYTNNFITLRVLSAHELGHLWDGVHSQSDPTVCGACPTTIMHPTITTSATTWSTGNTIRINNHVHDIDTLCLSLCGLVCDLSISSVTPTAETCPGSNDGTLDIVVLSGPIGPIKYLITGPAPSTALDSNSFGLFTNLEPGTYNVQVSAFYGTCVDLGMATVPDGMDASIPMIICPTNITVDNDINMCGAFVNFSSVLGTDNCDPSLIIHYMLSGVTSTSGMFILGQASGIFYNIGITTLTYRATDDSGNTSSCAFTINVRDTENPEAICEDIFVPVDSDCEYLITPADVDGGSTDNCGIISYMISKDGGPFVSSIMFDIDDLADPFVPVTLRLQDAAGNVSFCVATVTVIDVDDPMVICQDDVTIDTEAGACYGEVPNVLPPIDATDNCAPVVNLDQIPEPGLLFGSAHGDSIEILVIATDIDGNMDTCSLFAYLNDNQEPRWLNCPRPDIEEKAMPGMCAAFVNFSLPIPDDNCTVDTVIQVDGTGLTSGDMFPVGLTILKWISVDMAGIESDTCRIKIFVNDQQEPDLTCPDDVTAFNDFGNCSAVVFDINPTVDDNCMTAVTFKVENPGLGDGILTAGADDASGTEFGCGTNTVTYRLIDRPVLLISEVTHELEALNGGTDPVPGFIQTISGDDYLEITNYGPSTMDVSCLAIERIGGNNEIFIVPDGVILAVGEVLTIHYGSGTNSLNFYNVVGAANLAQGAPASYILSIDTITLDVVAVNGANPVGAAVESTVLPSDWSGILDMSEGGSAYRKWAWDSNNEEDYAIADLCAPATIGSLNPGTDLLADNGELASLQSLHGLVVECEFDVTVQDTELPRCGEWEEHNYPGGGGPIASGVLFEAQIIVGDIFEVGNVNLLNLNGTHADMSELMFKLTSPEGTTVVLFDNLCAGDANFDFGLDSDSTETINNAPCGPLGDGGIYAPMNSLEIFNGETSFGTWTLTIADGTAGNNGVLTANWILQLQERLAYSQGDEVMPNDPGLCSAEFTWIHPRLFDNCHEGTIFVSYSTLDDINVPSGGFVEGGTEITEVFEVGTTTVTYTLTDKADNTNECSFTVTVVDVEPPVVICPADLTFNLLPGACDIIHSFAPLSATDNCEVVDTLYYVEDASGMTIQLDEGTYTFPIGTTTVTFVIFDPAGNSHTCSFDVIVIEFIPTENSLACNDQVQISLDQTCTAEITADMILEGNNYRCYDNYCIQVRDINGNLIPGNIVTQDHIGTNVTVSVTDCLGTGNSCWGIVSVEDKLIPEISCPEDITVDCNQSTDVIITGTPQLLSCEISVTMDYEDEVIDHGECGVPRVEINRTWIVTDESGNAATCLQHITVAPFELDSVEFPPDFVQATELLCEDVIANPALVEPEYTGIPTINGISVFGDHYCELNVGYWDELLWDANCETSYEILRHWIIRDECLPLVEGVNPLRHIQSINVKDRTAPVVNGWAIGESNYSSGNNCIGRIAIGAVPHDACSDVVSVWWKVYYTLGGITQKVAEGTLPQKPFAILPLERTYRVDIYAKDLCGNTSKQSIDVNLEDDQPPVPLCDEHTILALTFDSGLEQGLTKIYAETFDDGSYDNCGPVTFLVRRMTSCIDFDWIGPPPLYGEYPNNDGGQPESMDLGLTFQEWVPFACCDVGTTVMVELRVTDMHGNINSCMVEVEIQDKLPPLIVCPPDITVSCEFWFDAHETDGFEPLDGLENVFGRVLDAYDYHESDREWIIISDPGNDVIPQPHHWGLDGWADDNCDIDVDVRTRLFDDCSGNDLPGDAPQWAVRLVERTFRAQDAQGNTSTCRQRIWVVDYDPFYIEDEICGLNNADDVRWPCDLILTDCPQGELTPENLIEYAPNNRPIVNDDNCSIIGVTYEDQIFYFVDNACYKIVRTWTVIDWCQYESDGEGGHYGYWTYVQVIKVHDEDGAEFLDCPDGPLTYCVEDPNVELPANNQVFLGEANPNSSKCSVHVWESRTVYETCSDHVIYDVKIYPYNHAEFVQIVAKTTVVVDTNGQAVLTWDTRQNSLPSNHAIRRYGLPYNDRLCSNWPFAGGEKDYHRVLWSVEDGCGNLSTCEYLFRLEDCKKPTPICVGLSSVVMPSSGSVTIWAADFDSGSSVDDCTTHDYLLFSFSGSTYQPSRVFDCDAIAANGSPSFLVEIWVADEGNDLNCSGRTLPLVGILDTTGIQWNERNKDFCTTFIVVDDNEIVCGDGAGGVIETEEQETVELVTVNLTNPATGQLMATYMTTENGLFHFVNPLLGYEMTSVRNDDHKNGVSTLDLVKIQKHLLGIQLLDSPYKLIAADANNSESVSALDLVEIRKLILGLFTEFPKSESWRFVNSTFEFADPSSPWPFDEVVSVAGLTMGHDFIGVKVGDVNGNVVANATQVQVRNAKGVLEFSTDAQTVVAGQTVTVPVSAKNFANVLGYQFTMKTAGLQLTGVEAGALDMSSENIGVHDGAITVSWNMVSPVSSDDVLFTLTFTATESGDLSKMLAISTSTKLTEAEAYNGKEEVLDVALTFNNGVDAGKDFALFQNEPNPFEGNTEIGFTLPEAMDATVTVYDVTGKVIRTIEGSYAQGYNEVKLNRKDLASTGVMYYRLDASEFTATKKMIAID